VQDAKEAKLARSDVIWMEEVVGRWACRYRMIML